MYTRQQQAFDLSIFAQYQYNRTTGKNDCKVCHQPMENFHISELSRHLGGHHSAFIRYLETNEADTTTEVECPTVVAGEDHESFTRTQVKTMTDYVKDQFSTAPNLQNRTCLICRKSVPCRLESLLTHLMDHVSISISIRTNEPNKKIGNQAQPGKNKSKNKQISNSETGRKQNQNGVRNPQTPEASSTPTVAQPEITPAPKDRNSISMSTRSNEPNKKIGDQAQPDKKKRTKLISSSETGRNQNGVRNPQTPEASSSPTVAQLEISPAPTRVLRSRATLRKPVDHQNYFDANSNQNFLEILKLNARVPRKRSHGKGDTPPQVKEKPKPTGTKRTKLLSHGDSVAETSGSSNMNMTEPSEGTPAPVNAKSVETQRIPPGISISTQADAEPRIDAESQTENPERNLISREFLNSREMMLGSMMVIRPREALIGSVVPESRPESPTPSAGDEQLSPAEQDEIFLAEAAVLAQNCRNRYMNRKLYVEDMRACGKCHVHYERLLQTDDCIKKHNLVRCSFCFALFRTVDMLTEHHIHAHDSKCSICGEELPFRHATFHTYSCIFTNLKDKRSVLNGL